ncbi:hypothetical protein FISHEDRAFT_78729 [Fistulina hepatica ATCC 64428]|uniref:Uncharacterized protein n=1 Tax=Fistulina hepatica ATCC 64428 TaxID=1128425 RepID=A0A0D7A0B2_9AGAR|nr:hypothetical protein FISHEDRAFT_78729 [Fistulina hepatica ATCC 64428]
MPDLQMLVEVSDAPVDRTGSPVPMADIKPTSAVQALNSSSSSTTDPAPDTPADAVTTIIGVATIPTSDQFVYPGRAPSPSDQHKEKQKEKEPEKKKKDKAGKKLGPRKPTPFASFQSTFSARSSPAPSARHARRGTPAANAGTNARTALRANVNSSGTASNGHSPMPNQQNPLLARNVPSASLMGFQQQGPMYPYGLLGEMPLPSRGIAPPYHGMQPPSIQGILPPSLLPNMHARLPNGMSHPDIRALQNLALPPNAMAAMVRRQQQQQPGLPPRKAPHLPFISRRAAVSNSPLLPASNDGRSPSKNGSPSGTNGGSVSPMNESALSGSSVPTRNVVPVAQNANNSSPVPVSQTTLPGISPDVVPIVDPAPAIGTATLSVSVNAAIASAAAALGVVNADNGSIDGDGSARSCRSHRGAPGAFGATFRTFVPSENGPVKMHEPPPTKKDNDARPESLRKASPLARQSPPHVPQRQSPVMGMGTASPAPVASSVANATVVPTMPVSGMPFNEPLPSPLGTLSPRAEQTSSSMQQSNVVPSSTYIAQQVPVPAAYASNPYAAMFPQRSYPAMHSQHILQQQHVALATGSPYTYPAPTAAHALPPPVRKCAMPSCENYVSVQMRTATRCMDCIRAEWAHLRESASSAKRVKIENGSGGAAAVKLERSGESKSQSHKRNKEQPKDKKNQRAIKQDFDGDVKMEDAESLCASLLLTSEADEPVDGSIANPAVIPTAVLPSPGPSSETPTPSPDTINSEMQLQPLHPQPPGIAAGFRSRSSSVRMLPTPASTPPRTFVTPSLSLLSGSSSQLEATGSSMSDALLSPSIAAPSSSRTVTPTPNGTPKNPGQAISGWDSDLTDIEDVEMQPAEQTASSGRSQTQTPYNPEDPQPVQPHSGSTGSHNQQQDAIQVIYLEQQQRLTIRVPAQQQQLMEPVRECGEKYCHNLLGSDYKWKLCVHCRKRARDYQRQRLGIQIKDKEEDEERRSTSDGPIQRNKFNFDDALNAILADSSRVVKGARVCTIRNCPHILPSVEEYTWKMCCPCRARTRRNARARRGAPDPSDPVNGQFNWKLDAPLSRPPRKRCASLDCGLLVDGQEIVPPGIRGSIPGDADGPYPLCEQCIERIIQPQASKRRLPGFAADVPTQRMYRGVGNSSRLPNAHPRKGDWPSGDCSPHHANGAIPYSRGPYKQYPPAGYGGTPPASRPLSAKRPRLMARAPTPYSEYQGLQYLLADFRLQFHSFLDTRLRHYTIIAKTEQGVVPPDTPFGDRTPTFIFEGEYSVVAPDYDVQGRQIEVSDNILDVKASLAEATNLNLPYQGDLRFLPTKPSGLCIHFFCQHNVDTPRRVDDQVMKESQMTQGELEITVMADGSHRIFPGQRTVVRFRLLG